MHEAFVVVGTDIDAGADGQVVNSLPQDHKGCCMVRLYSCQHEFIGGKKWLTPLRRSEA